MNRALSTLAIAAAAALAGCEQETVTPRGPYDPNANLTNRSGPIELPPAITSSHAYRCKDNSLVYIDWYSDGSARVKATPTEAGTHVPAPAPDAAEPPQLVGSASATTITYAGKSCRR